MRPKVRKEIFTLLIVFSLFFVFGGRASGDLLHEYSDFGKECGSRWSTIYGVDGFGDNLGSRINTTGLHIYDHEEVSDLYASMCLQEPYIYGGDETWSFESKFAEDCGDIDDQDPLWTTVLDVHNLESAGGARGSHVFLEGEAGAGAGELCLRHTGIMDVEAVEVYHNNDDRPTSDPDGGIYHYFFGSLVDRKDNTHIADLFWHEGDSPGADPVGYEVWVEMRRSIATKDVEGGVTQPGNYEVSCEDSPDCNISITWTGDEDVCSEIVDCPTDGYHECFRCDEFFEGSAWYPTEVTFTATAEGNWELDEWEVCPQAD